MAHTHPHLYPRKKGGIYRALVSRLADKTRQGHFLGPACNKRHDTSSKPSNKTSKFDFLRYRRIEYGEVMTGDSELSER